VGHRGLFSQPHRGAAPETQEDSLIPSLRAEAVLSVTIPQLNTPSNPHRIQIRTTTEVWYLSAGFLPSDGPSGRVWGNVARLWAERL
jgi:hypothetical protein